MFNLILLFFSYFFIIQIVSTEDDMDMYDTLESQLWYVDNIDSLANLSASKTTAATTPGSCVFENFGSSAIFDTGSPYQNNMRQDLRMNLESIISGRNVVKQYRSYGTCLFTSFNES